MCLHMHGRDANDNATLVSALRGERVEKLLMQAKKDGSEFLQNLICASSSLYSIS